MPQASPSLQWLQPDKLIVMGLDHSHRKVMKDVAAWGSRLSVHGVV